MRTRSRACLGRCGRLWNGMLGEAIGNGTIGKTTVLILPVDCTIVCSTCVCSSSCSVAYVRRNGRVADRDWIAMGTIVSYLTIAIE